MSKIVKTINTRIQIKRDTAANWETNNPVLLNGEEIIVDTSVGEVRKKIGDGIKTYTQLPFTDETLRNSISGKVDKVSGKGLSTNDFTADYKTKLDGIAEGANKYTHPTYTAKASGLYKITVDSIGHVSATAAVTKADITGLGIPAQDTTYNEATTSITGLMSATDKAKLDGIESGANNYTHPSTHTASMITQDATHRFVTDSEKTAWNAKASSDLATTESDGLMSSTMVAKLNGIAEGANNYTHPSTHAASMITQDASHRFVTDTEKSTWNSKASTAIASTTANGLMSSADKTKLDGIASGANKTVVDDALDAESTNPVQNKVINTALSGKANSTHTHTKSQITDFPTSLKNPTALTISLNGTSQGAYDGSTAKSVNITAASIGADASGAASTALSSAKSYTDTKISDLINGAPDTLDTLGEIADAMKTNDNVVSALNTAIGTKANSSDLTSHTGNTTVHITSAERTTWNAKASTAIATTKANGLMSATDKTKLDGIAEGANAYTHPSSHAATMITQDASHRFVTDTEKSTWNSKASTDVATTSANGLMSSTMVTKLNGIAEGATKITVDSTLSSTSTNPLQNKIVNSELSSLKTRVSTLESNYNTLLAKVKTAVFWS